MTIVSMKLLVNEASQFISDEVGTSPIDIMTALKSNCLAYSSGLRFCQRDFAPRGNGLDGDPRAGATIQRARPP